MASIDHDLHPSNAARLPAETAAATGDAVKWGNSAPLALAAFAVTTFMLSMVNSGIVNIGVLPAVFGVALMFGGLTQLVAAFFQFRIGNTFAGVLFGTFGAFWLSLYALAEFFLKDVPAAQAGHALGLFLYAFGIFTVWILAASFRTNILVVAALADLVATFFVLGAGNWGGNATVIHAGGYLGLVAAALAAYLSCAEVCEASYGHPVLPVWSLAKR